jgi:threonine dehydrogenase-like Zn-dependent dehydrogenase
MRAITVLPGSPQSGRLDEVLEPPRDAGSVLVRALALGVCGTDREIIAGEYGSAPQGSERLILGHESLGEVEDAPAGSGLSRGDRVVGITRMPDPVPCFACAAGDWDMCRNGRYTEHGIKELHGFGAEHYRLEPHHLLKVDSGLGILGVLIEPTSIVAKAWEHVERIGKRSASWKPGLVLITGAGSIGFLAALLGRQRGLRVAVYDRNHSGPKPELIRQIGAQHYSDLDEAIALDPDIVIECTGAAAVISKLITHPVTAKILCLVGISNSKTVPIDIGAINRQMVLGNEAIFGSVNANRGHYEAAGKALVKADANWLSRLISRRVELQDWETALEHRQGDIKVVIDFSL